MTSRPALNAAWPRLSADRKQLNPTFLAIVKAGFKGERIDDDDDASVARDNQILRDEEVGGILQAKYEVDQEQGFDGDLYRIVVCLAATGARYAQVRRMRVGDVQGSARRLMVPGSYKGRGGNGGSDPIPVGDDVIEVLLPAIAGRPSDAPLFERWIHEQEPGGTAWKKSERGPWKSGELARPWKAFRRARRYATGDSLCFAALEYRARSPKGLAHPTDRQTAQHLSQDDRAALREIHCDRIGGSRSGGSRVAGTAQCPYRSPDSVFCARTAALRQRPV
jgi:integrase